MPQGRGTAETARRRLSREDRRNQILDCAQAIIVRAGLSSLTMEALAVEAGVSNPLIYKYFDTRQQILHELLAREYAAFRETVKARLQGLTDYREIVRVYVDTNFRQFADGNIITILLGQADIRQAIGRREQVTSGHAFVAELAREYGIDKRLAEPIVVMASGASLAAAEHYSRHGGDREALIDQTVEFIFGGIDSSLR